MGQRSRITTKPTSQGLKTAHHVSSSLVTHPQSAIAPPKPIAPVLHDILQPRLRSEPAQTPQSLNPDTGTSDARSAHATGLPDRLRAGVESLSGIDMSQVSVHYNSARPAQFNALAYAQGSQIHLAPGQAQELSHEVWHVVQQAQGRVRPTQTLRGEAIALDPQLEKEADVMGARAIGSVGDRRFIAPRPLSTPILSSGPVPLQMRRTKQANPVLISKGYTAPTVGEKKVEQHATALSDAVETGYTDVTAKIAAWEAGTMTAKQVETFFNGTTSGSYTSNFVNRLTDWQLWGKGKALAKAAAGYIIEDYATKVAIANGLTSQVAIDGARPDFEVATGNTWTPMGSTKIPADGFIDATSETEASKGHVSGKVLKMSEDNAIAHPHLYDVWYPGIVLGKAPTVTKAAVDDDEVIKQRIGKQVKLAKERTERKGSLRSAQSKGITKPNPNRTKVAVRNKAKSKKMDDS